MRAAVVGTRALHAGAPPPADAEVVRPVVAEGKDATVEAAVTLGARPAELGRVIAAILTLLLLLLLLLLLA